MTILRPGVRDRGTTRRPAAEVELPIKSAGRKRAISSTDSRSCNGTYNIYYKYLQNTSNTSDRSRAISNADVGRIFSARLLKQSALQRARNVPPEHSNNSSVCQAYKNGGPSKFRGRHRQNRQNGIIRPRPNG